MLERWIVYSDLNSRIELGAIITYLGIGENCQFADSAVSLREFVVHARPQDYSVLVGGTGSEVSDINLAAAIVNDGNARCVVLVRANASGSLRSRASRAGIDLVIDPLELGDLVKVGRGYQLYGADRFSSPLPESSRYYDKVKEFNAFLKSLQPSETLKAPIITFASGRGGSGKTTVVSSMAAIAVSWGLKTAVVDLDFSYGNVFEKFGIRQPKDFVDFIDKVPVQGDDLLSRATCVRKNFYLFGPCVKPEMAEILFPCVANFLHALSGFVDLVLVDTTSASTDCFAQAAQAADRLVLVSENPVTCINSLAKVSGLAVRLGIARTRIVRVENKANPRVRQDFSIGKIEVGLEAAKMFRIFEGGQGFNELVQQGKLEQLLHEETPFSESVLYVLASLLDELGLLPQVEEAQMALQLVPSRKGFSLFGRRREVG